MDTLSLLGSLWRHRVITTLVVLITAGCGAGLLVTYPPPLSGTASYLLVEPPEPPTDAELKADATLAEADTDNPYLRYGDPSVIVDVVTRQIETTDTQRALEAGGGSPDFEVQPSNRYGTNSPIIEITSTGASEAVVVASLNQLGQDLDATLASVQADDGIDDRYVFTLRRIKFPDELDRQLSSTLRMLVGVSVLGLLLLFVSVGAAEGRLRRRRSRADNDRRTSTDLSSVPRAATLGEAGSAAAVDDQPRVEVGPGVQDPAVLTVLPPQRDLRTQALRRARTSGIGRRRPRMAPPTPPRRLVPETTPPGPAPAGPPE